MHSDADATLPLAGAAETAAETLAAATGRLAREARWFADGRVLASLRRVRRAIKADRRPCPDTRRGRSYGDIMWSPKPWWCEQFYRGIRRDRPAEALEIGTSLGMTGLYVLAALARNGRGTFTTVEHLPTKVAYARRLFAAFGPPAATCIQGRSDEVLPDLLGQGRLFDWVFVDIDHSYETTVAHLALLEGHVRPGGVVVFDDIALNDGMRRAWSEVRRHPGYEWSTLSWHRRRRREPRVGIGRRR